MSKVLDEELPEGWVKCELGDLGKIVTGKTPSTKDTSNFDGKILFVKPGDLDFCGYIYDTKQKLTDKGLSGIPSLPKDSIMVTCIGNIGKVGLTSCISATNQQINSLVPYIGINSKYVYYYLLTLKNWLVENSSATTISIINKSRFSKAPFILSSLNEQQEIAKRLDILLKHVDAIKSRIDEIPKILKEFRQSVLMFAANGRLTENWRKNDDYVDTVFGWAAPTTWLQTTIGDVAQVKGGKRLPKGESLIPNNTGHPYIRAGQLKNGTVSEDDQMYIEQHVHKKISQYVVNENDVYITIVGACIGDAGLIPAKYNNANLTENAAKICKLNHYVNECYLSIWMRSNYLQGLIKFEIKSGAQGKLALKRIKTLPFSLPPLEEQAEIVRRVDEYFKLVDSIEVKIKAAQVHINFLTQSILYQAFKGNLTKDWRRDNHILISGRHSPENLLNNLKVVKSWHEGNVMDREAVEDINQIFLKYNIDDVISRSDVDIKFNPKGYGWIMDTRLPKYPSDKQNSWNGESYATGDGVDDILFGANPYPVKKEPKLSNIIANHLFPIVNKICVYHYTSMENLENILRSQSIRLTNIKKRYTESEIETFYKYFPSSSDNTDEMNREYFNTIVERVFYASFTEQKEESFFKTFEASSRLKIEITTSKENNKLRKIFYQDSIEPNILSELTEILLNKHKLKLTMNTQREYSAFMLPKKFSHEKEIRALYNFPLDSPLDVKQDGMYTYIDVPLNIMDERTGFKFRILEVYAEERPDEMPEDIPFSKRDISKN